MRYFLIVLISLLSFFSCSKQASECVEAPPKTQNVSIEIEALQNEIPNLNSKQAVVDFLGRNPVLRDFVLQRSAYPNDSVFINTVYNRFNNPHFDSLVAETNKVFGDQSTLEQEFSEAFNNLKSYFPDVKVPAIKTMVTGMDTDLFISDTLIVVGLDFYLGPKAKYRPNMYEYILRQYIPENIVPSVMLLYGIDTRINATNLQDKTVLADMIAYGKSYYLAKHTLPCKPDSIFMHYSKKEIEGARKNQDLIWYRLVEDKALYATTNQFKQRYLAERPKTVEVGPECPGRIGKWVGWQIVNSYMANNPEVSMQQLMKMDNADQLFKDSKYKASRK